ncbi:hypothetical protein BVG16_25320 [Paenibacillus selenitireducens]|uniref:ABC transporter ATP-binding protein n=2 Tax=Paenibacillus selenitireducens TaxID=1324314 RepID=A0A1T2X3B9_9BACL|nr:ABC transporter ATP-binding protein [Paenibacillus selenitireducens]OPA74073.1 hypothetical protein BVG16_25320 [Paenibacillus selenitireducens]
MKKRPISYFFSQVRSKKFIISIIALIILNIFTSYFSLIPVYLIQIIFDKIISNFDFNQLFRIIVLLILFFLLYGILNIITTLFYVKILNSSSLIFRKKFLSSYLSKDYNSLSKYSEGDIIYRGNSDIQHINQISLELLIKTFTQFTFIIGLLILMFKSSIILSACVLLMMLIEYFYNYFCANRLKSKLDILKISDSNLLEIYKQIINRYIYIRLNRLQEKEIVRFTDVLSECLKNTERYYFSQSIISAVTNIISGSRQMLVLAIGAYLIYQGQLSIGVLIAFNQLVNSLASPMQFFSSWIHHYKDLLSSHERIEEIMKTVIHDQYNLIEESNEKLACKEVNLIINDVQLMRNINFTLYSKEKVALVGESGSGKSTFCKLIAGLYLYDGEIILSHNKNKDKPTIGFMLDESTVFRGSLWDNITYGLVEEQKDINVIKKILDKLCLEYLYIQNDGLNLIIDKNVLSKGEKQRLELARIMLLKPDLIILDEPTSGLDELTEKIVWGNFRVECAESTILYTTHKRGIIYSNDRILQMNRGTISEYPLVDINELEFQR